MTRSQASKSSMARTFLTTVAGMAALGTVVMAASFDQDGQANAATPMTGMQALEAMTAPQAAPEIAMSSCGTVAVLAVDPMGGNINTASRNRCQ